MHEVIADELAGCHPAALLWGELPRPEHELEGHRLRLGMSVSGALGEDVPDGDEESASDGDDGDLGGFVPGETMGVSYPPL